MNYEDRIKAEIKERLKNAPRFYLYCSVCAKYLCSSSRFTKYIVHWDCRNKEIKHYNSDDNPAPNPK